MPPHSPPSPSAGAAQPSKRPRQSSPEWDSPASSAEPSPATATDPNDTHDDLGSGAALAKVGQSSNFRNVSACNRCRLRKNRCDQSLPSCSSCEKACVPCVGYDPITKREIPRSYVYYLETRVQQLEALLEAHDIKFPPAQELEHCSRPGTEAGLAPAKSPPPEGDSHQLASRAGPSGPPQNSNGEEKAKVTTKAAQHGAPGSRHLGAANGLSFHNLLSSSVYQSFSDRRSASDKTGVRPSKPIADPGPAASGTSMRDSFFGLHTKQSIKLATFPDKDLAHKLITLYFEYANPQIPVLHREDFAQTFERAYAPEGAGRVRGPKELYMLNMVFAIGSGIIMDEKPSKTAVDGAKPRQAQPEEYYSSAMEHYDACLNKMGGGLEELQALLLRANFALFRPVHPGLWYIVGNAVRTAVDLGLHYEDGKDVGHGLTNDASARERGRREYVRDMRRRLWWSTYSLDRLVSSCVGRPFGVSDQVITTEFPSCFDDKYITPDGITCPRQNEPSYKVVAYHYFRLRLLQSEILQVLQYQQTQIARQSGQNTANIYIHQSLPSPFLARLGDYGTFRNWRQDVDRRLMEWKKSAPDKRQTGVLFSTEFLELNYWQTIIMLYRQSLSVPAMFEGEYNTSKEVNSPSVYPAELKEDEERVYLKVAEAGQKIIRLYRQLHLGGLVNYTYLATHHLFMAGISYLYAIWHSPIVRSRLGMDEVDFTRLACTSVLADLGEKCPPAEACRDAFDRTAKATIRMVNATGGFGQTPGRSKQGSVGSPQDYMTSRDASVNRMGQRQQRSSLEAARRSNTPYTTSQLNPLQTNQQFRLAMPNNNMGIKTEPDTFSLFAGAMPAPGSNNRSRTGSENGGFSPENAAIDPSLLPSPGGAQAQHVQSPLSTASMTTAQFPQQGGGGGNLMRSPSNSFTPYADLQGIDFLQSLQNGTGAGMGGGGQAADAEMDLGFGLGWEGLNHDFSDGQQLDLFNGFFFGGGDGGMGM